MCALTLHRVSMCSHLRLLRSLRTAEFARGQGQAGELMRQVCQEADKNRIVMMLEPKPFNREAMTQAELIGWYERLGFRTVQTEPSHMMARPVGGAN
jgi:ribosomal protein S18 acetylase RimI-like enzyme